MKLDEKETLLGFYTTVFVSSETTEDAKAKALARVRERLGSQPAPNSSPAPWKESELDLVVDEIEETGSADSVSDYGFAWYEED